MIKALSLAAALALLPLSAAVAQEAKGASEAALEAAAAAFEARMESFGERAEAISADESLSEEQRGLRIAALWTEYQPDVAAFTATVTANAGSIAAEALADIDVETLVSEALAGVDVGTLTTEAMANIDVAALTADVMASPEVAGALASAQGVAVNGSWASNDPEHMATYGLVADYALGEALDAADEAGAEIADAVAAVDVDADVDDAPEAVPTDD
jgi:hypothetical protein